MASHAKVLQASCWRCNAASTYSKANSPAVSKASTTNYWYLKRLNSGCVAMKRTTVPKRPYTTSDLLSGAEAAHLELEVRVVQHQRLGE